MGAPSLTSESQTVRLSLPQVLDLAMAAEKAGRSDEALRLYAALGAQDARRATLNVAARAEAAGRDAAGALDRAAEAIRETLAEQEAR